MRLCAVWHCGVHAMSIDKSCCDDAVKAGWIEMLTPDEERRAGLEEPV